MIPGGRRGYVSRGSLSHDNGSKQPQVAGEMASGGEKLLD